MHKKQVVIIAGPTGSGESTITKTLLSRFPDRFRRLVTATTRSPRTGEQNKIDYYFFTKEEFLAKKESGEILESTYVENRDAYYGTYAPDLEEKIASGHIILINPDIVGTKYYKANYDATTIFIKTPAIDDMIARIRQRNPEMSEEELVHRHEQAMKELEDEPLYDYVVLNTDGKLDDAVNEVIEILRKEGYTLES